MEIAGRRLPSMETVGRVLANMRLPEAEKLPLVMAYYFTYDCNGNCWYCSQKDDLNSIEEPSLGRQIEVIKRIREGCPNIYLMGGEPTMSPHLPAILKECEFLGFDTIAVNTNGLKYAPEILEYANMLVVSLPSMDPEEIERTLDIEKGTGFDVIENINHYATARDSGHTQMVVNTVVTGDNITEAYRIANFCSDLGIMLNVAPAIMLDGRPDRRLIDNPKYIRLIDDLIADSRLMACSTAYLKTIREFDDFACTPNAVPGVCPNGDMIVPCQGVERPVHVNLISEGSVARAMEIGRRRFKDFDPAVDCPDKCHKTCYIEAANLADVPSLLAMLRRVFVRNKFVDDDVDEMKGEEWMLRIIDEYFSHLGQYDPIMHSKVAKIGERFSGEIQDLSEAQLAEVRSLIEEVIYGYEKFWEIGPGDVQKVVLALVDVVVNIFNRPFPRIVPGSDFMNGRKNMRMKDYLRRVDRELGMRKKRVEGGRQYV